MTDPRDPEADVANQTLLRIDHSPSFSASSKLLVWFIGGYIALISTFGPGILDTRIERFTQPIATGLGQVQQTAESTNKQVAAIITKDVADDEATAKSRERLALLEQRAVQGREERLAFQTKTDERLNKLIDQNSEILRLVIALQTKQEMMLQRQGFNVIPRQGEPSLAR